MKFGLEENIIEKITRVLEEQPKVDKAYIFGSRAKGDYRPDSDIDIALKGYDLTVEDLLKLGAAIDKLKIGYEVDFVDYNSIKEEALKEHVNRVGKEFYNSWTEYKLGDVCSKIGSGATPRGGGNVYKLEGISLIRSQNVLDLSFSYEGLAFIDEDQANELRSVTVKENDILLNITGDSVARVCKVPKEVLPARVNQHVAIIRSNNQRVICDYLLYYLFSIKEHLLSLSEIGGTRNALTKGMLEELNILLPNINNQVLVAEALKNLDNKIDLLHRQNKTLESMAEVLFRQWFVVEEDDEWEETVLERHVEVYRGLSYNGEGLTEEDSGLPMHNLNSIFEGGGYKYAGIKYYKGEYRDRHLVYPEDIIVANTEQGHEYRLIGFPAVVPTYFGSKGLFSQHIYKLALTPGTYLTSEFIYYLLMTPLVREQIIGATNGSTVNMLASDGLQRPSFKVPPKEKVVEFSKITSQYWLKQNNNHDTIKVLVNLRDTLIPKLLSGEARVKMS
jgi:type I restriction enzyme S subunit